MMHAFRSAISTFTASIPIAPANGSCAAWAPRNRFVEPLDVYRNARQKGMDFVTISDHNCIRGALEIAHLPGTFISNEVTTYFPENGSKVHVLVTGINEEQFRMIQELRADIYRLQEYLMGEDIICSVAHVRSGSMGGLTDRPVRAVAVALSALRVDQRFARPPRRRTVGGHPRQSHARDDRGDGRPAGNRALRAAALEEGLDCRQRRSQRGLHGHGLYQDAAGLRASTSTWPSCAAASTSRRRLRRQRADGPRLLSHRLQLLPGPLRPRQQGGKPTLVGQLFERLLKTPTAESSGWSLKGLATRLFVSRKLSKLSETEQQLVADFRRLFPTRRSSKRPSR